MSSSQPAMSALLAAAIMLLAVEPRSLAALIGFAGRASRRTALGSGLAPRLSFWVSTLTILAAFLLVTVAAAWPRAVPAGLPVHRAALVFPLLVLAILDARAYWLPFSLTVPLAACGIVAGLLEERWPEAVVGCVLWGGLPWLVGEGYRLWRGRPGLGRGDVVLAAGIGAWAGPAAGATAVMIATAAAIAWTVASRHLGLSRGDRWPRIPLGTFLCLGMWAGVLLDV